MRLVLALALFTISTLGCGPRHGRGRYELEGPKHVTEVTGRDLSPAEEIDALLEGTSEMGRGSTRIKVAVLPFEVRSGDTAMGGMVADVVAHSLTGAEGVTVLERERVDILVDELRRGTKPDFDKLTEKAKLAGVDAYVLGTVHGGKRGEGTVYCRVVDTAAGVRRKDLEIPLDGRRWREGVATKSRELARELGVKDRGRRSEAPHDLDAEALSKATQARELQYSGKTAEAARLYAEAMPEPGTAWQLEADYISLMNEFEMDEWVQARADAVLERLPPGPSTVCTRARLLGLRLPQRVTTSAHLEDARMAVRVAASCGDPSVIATALMEYADVAKSVNIPLAVEAVDRADRLVGDRAGWDRCEVKLRRAWYRVVDGRGGAEQRRDFMDLAKVCAKVNNHHAAALAALVAAGWAWSLEDAIADLAQGVAWAERSGGVVVSDLRIAHANALRSAGYTSKADDELLALLAGSLRATIEIHGALPATEARIDDELLARAGVKRPVGVARRLAGDAELRAKFIRRSLAAALQQWAIRTRTDSGPEAAFYAEIAAELDPRIRPDNAAPIDRLRARGIDLDVLLALDSAPHREVAPDYPFALDMLSNMFMGAREQDAPPAERERLLAAFKRIAGWEGAQAYARSATWLSARHLADLGNLKHALSELRALDARAGDDPRWDVGYRYPLEAEILQRQGSQELEALLKKWLAAAEKVSATTWVDVAGRVEALRLERAPRTEPERAKAMLDIGNRLIDRKQWLPAAGATVAAALLVRRANLSGGTQGTVDLLMQRVAVIDNLGDPVRSALARADVLSDIASLYANALEPRHVQLAFGADPTVQAVMQDLATHVEKLVAEGRARDAVRVIVSIPGTAPGADRLLGLAEQLAPSFAQSLEHPLLVGNWWLRVSERMQGPQHRAALEQAFGFLQQTDRRDLAQQTLISLLGTAADETQLGTDYERCVAMAAGVPAQRLACLGGLASYVVSAGNAGRRIKKPELFASGLVEINAIWQRQGESMAEFQRVLLKETGLLLAVAAGDFALVEKLLTELVVYFETQAESPHLGNFGVTLWLAARLEHPQEAIAAIERVARSVSAGDRFVAQLAADPARAAWQLGDSARADRLYATGRAAAERAYVDLLFRYDLLVGDRALVARRPAVATVEYERVRDSDEAKRNHVVAGIALSRLAAAALARDPRFDIEAAASAAPDTSANPCSAADWLELRAAASLARRQCAEGQKLRDEAAVRGAACTEPAFRLRSENRCGKPFVAVIGESR